ncbi:TetR/AcrR family transcriptional regulator [Barrientosiimonas marina]|uniref:TetR/AcrR family transcriptional regulator n=1 Tax=Lentibacillus kimchii TaxID=1542911 RepID=A0ABW2UPV0_9BACI
MLSLREQKTQKKKDDIVQSALQMIAEKGYHATTMEDIASNLLMTKGSVYYYFKNKQDLLFQSQKSLLEQSIRNIDDIMQKHLTTAEKLEETMAQHTDYLITERTGFGMGLRPEQFFEGGQLKDIIDLRDTYSSKIDSLIAIGIEEGSFHDVDITIVRNIIVGAMNYVIEWYSPEGTWSQATLARSISSYLKLILVKD